MLPCKLEQCDYIHIQHIPMQGENGLDHAMCVVSSGSFVAERSRRLVLRGCLIGFEVRHLGVDRVQLIVELLNVLWSIAQVADQPRERRQRQEALVTECEMGHERDDALQRHRGPSSHCEKCRVGFRSRQSTRLPSKLYEHVGGLTMEGVRREDRGVRSLHASLSVDCQVHGAGMLTRSTGGKLHPRSRHATRSTEWESQTNFGDGHARTMWKLCWLAPTPTRNGQYARVGRR